jgi:hypothetical protein
MKTPKHTLAAAIVVAVLWAALPARAQTFLPPGALGSVTLTALDGATSLAGGVLRASARELAEDEDYSREAVLFQIPRFESAPAAFTAPFAFTRNSRTRVILINSDDAVPLTVRAAFYDRAGNALGCHDFVLDPHERKARRVQEIPLAPCP